MAAKAATNEKDASVISQTTILRMLSSLGRLIAILRGGKPRRPLIIPPDTAHLREPAAGRAGGRS